MITSNDSASKAYKWDRENEKFIKGHRPSIWRGTIERYPIDARKLGPTLEEIKYNQVLVLGTIRAGFLDKVTLVLKGDPRDGQPGFASRSKRTFEWRAGEPCYVVLDVDFKKDSRQVRRKITALGGEEKILGGLHEALLQICPPLAEAGYALRKSTSTEISHKTSGTRKPGLGYHIWIALKDAAYAREFLQALHKACWRDGFGWCVIDTVGKVHARSLVDLSVQGAEWLMYEVPANLGPGLAQKRRPGKGPGIAELVDAQAFLATFSPGNAEELIATAKEAKEVDARPIKEKAQKRLGTTIREQVKETTGRNIPAEWLEKRVKAAVDTRILFPGIPVVVIIKEGKKQTVDVGEIMDKWEKYDLLECEHPHGYDHICSQILANQGYGIVIYTFAHGEQNFLLRWDYPSIKFAMEEGDEKKAAYILCRMIINSILDALEKEKLIQLAVERTGLGIKPVRKMVSEAEEKLQAALNKAEGKEGKEGKDGSEVDILLRLAHQDVTLFHCEDFGYAAILNKEKTMRATYCIKAKGFKKWLTNAYYTETQRAPTAQGLKTSLDALEAEANHGKEEKVFLRVGQAAGKIYLDLGNEKWEAVEIIVTNTLKHSLLCPDDRGVIEVMTPIRLGLERRATVSPTLRRSAPRHRRHAQ